MAKVYKGPGGLKSFAKDLIKSSKAAMVTAANRAIATGKSRALKDAGRDTGVTQKALKNRLVAFNARSNKPLATLYFGGKPIVLSAFTPRVKPVQSPRGKRYGATIKSASGRQLVAGGFIRDARSGRPEVFTSPRKGKLQLSRTDVVFKLWNTKLKGYEETVKAEFIKNFKHEIKRRGGG
jgi:hypothetical protein